MNDFYGIYLFILLPEIAILAVGMRQGCSGPLICIVGVVSLFMLGDDSREALLWLRRAVHAAIILSVICHGASENVVLGTLAKNYSEREKKNWMFFSFSVSGMMRTLSGTAGNGEISKSHASILQSKTVQQRFKAKPSTATGPDCSLFK